MSYFNLRFPRKNMLHPAARMLNGGTAGTGRITSTGDFLTT